MDLVVVILLALIVTIGVWVVLSSRKKKWYKVYLANNDVMLLYRDLRERWWRTSDRYMRFNKEDGTEITFPSNAHWVLFWEEVPNELISVARDEVRRLKQAKAKE